MQKHIYLFLGLITCHSAWSSPWSCTNNSQCSTISGGVCASGVCTCPAGKQVVIGGTECADLAPYYMSACVEDHQCSRMTTRYECSDPGTGDNLCRCQDGYHYFLGRCWESIDYDGTCVSDEECLGDLRDPYSMTCNGTCQCADDYYTRQKGECRKKSLAVGEDCILNEDCQFPGGACDDHSLTCFNVNDPVALDKTKEKLDTENSLILNKPKQTAEVGNIEEANAALRQHGATCSASVACPSPFECSNFGACVCPIGYYASSNGRNCLAELGSPAIEGQCEGIRAIVIDGVCKCQNNHYYDGNMRDCARIIRRTTETCSLDSHCHTYGLASRCGPPQEPWGFRYCECDLDISVWDGTRQMCRIYAGIGEVCDADSDCMAGELEIQCRQNDAGQSVCTCPSHLQEINGLCLTSGLGLGDSCQASYECTATENTACLAGVCSCISNYEAVGSSCHPTIGGSCTLDSECLKQNTVCRNTTAGAAVCQCREGFIEYEEECLQSLAARDDSCSVDVQCHQMLGTQSSCNNDSCVCNEHHHERDGGCWPIIELFSSCSRSSECYLGNRSEVVVCRNGLCQCHFDYPYEETLNTCGSSATTTIATISVTLAALVLSINRHL